jgi:hypothetical protein
MDHFEFRIMGKLKQTKRYKFIDSFLKSYITEYTK